MKIKLPEAAVTEGWFISGIEKFPSQRALLSLGLNSATRYYRELIVPGIGGVWFVRQLTWAVAGIELAGNSTYRPIKVANAIEALACKLQWEREQENYSGRGSRAFARDREGVFWSFNNLSDQIYYVQVTYRQSAVRALSSLGLAYGTRFNSMQLSTIGHDLANAFFYQNDGSSSKRSIYPALNNWINDSTRVIPKNTLQVITRDDPTFAEKRIVMDLLLSESVDNLSDVHRRPRLISAFGKNLERPPDIATLKKRLNTKNKEQCDNIDTAIAFDKLLSASQMVIHCASGLIESDPRITISGISENDNLQIFLSNVRESAVIFDVTKGKKHPNVSEYVSEIIQECSSSMDLLIAIVKRDGNILRYSNERIIKGPLFGHHKDISDADTGQQEQVGTEESSTEHKIKQLFSLWRDCQ